MVQKLNGNADNSGCRGDRSMPRRKTQAGGDSKHTKVGIAIDGLHQSSRDSFPDIQVALNLLMWFNIVDYVENADTAWTIPGISE